MENQEENYFSYLQPHLIEKILSYCFRDRHELKTVCTAFYEAIWKVHGEKWWLSLYGGKEGYLMDILSSSTSFRDVTKFPNVCINMSGIFQESDSLPVEMKEVLQKFFKVKGEFVRNLEFQHFTNTSHVQQVLQQTKNVTKLSLDFKKLKIDILDLTELKFLSEIEIKCDKSEVDYKELRKEPSVDLKLIKLPEDCVKTVRIEARKIDEENLCQFLKNSMKNLELDVLYFGSSKTANELTYENLKLVRLSLKIRMLKHSLNFFSRFMPKQSTLKFLVLNYPLTDGIFELITSSLPELEELTADLANIRPNNFDRIARLRKLKHVTISSRHLPFATNVQLQIPSIKLISCQIKQLDTANIIARKFPKLKRLVVDGEKPQELNYVQEQQLEQFKLLLFKVNSPSNIQPLDLQNHNLTAMTIHHPVRLDMKVLRSFPNLAELDLILDIQGSMKTEIKAILSEFSKLRKLHLIFCQTAILDQDILALVNGNSKLELIHFYNFKVDEAFSAAYDDKTIPPELGIKPTRYFEIFQVKRLGARYMNKSNEYSILFATDAAVLKESKENFFHNMDLRRFLDISNQSMPVLFPSDIYCCALKYFNPTDGWNFV